MAAEKILKKAFMGGFSRESVFSYIEKLQSENVSLKNEYDDRVLNDINELAEAERKISGLEKENRSLLEANASLTLRIEEANATIEAYEAKLAKCEEMTEEIERRFSELRSKYDRYGDADELITKAKASADEISCETQKALNDAAAKITAANDKFRNACSEIGTSTDTVRDGADELLRVINELSGRFSESGDEA